MTIWKEKVRVLHLEDNDDDVELLKMALRKSGLNVEIDDVSTMEAFQEVDLSKYDIVVTDYNLRGYDGLSAIKYVRANMPILPIILISGTVGEELAADLLRAGANDFVLKSNLKKAPIVMERVLHEASIAHEKRRFQMELVEKNLILDSIFDSFEDMIFLKDGGGKYVKVNRPFCEFLKLHEAEIIGCRELDIFPEDIANEALEKDDYVRLSNSSLTYEVEYNHNGVLKTLEVTKHPLVSDDTVTGIVGKCRDITSKKLLLEDVIKSKSILSQAEKLTKSGSFEYDSDLDLISCSSHFKHILKLQITGDSISFRKFTQLIKEEDRTIFNEGINRAIENYEEYNNEHRFFINPKDKSVIGYFKIVLRPDYKDSKAKRFYGTLVDVTAEHENQIYLMNKQENDRKELARELHDNLGQKINGISMFISKISDDIPENMDLKKVKNLTHETIDDLSYLINNISVKQIEEHSLNYAIDKLVSYMPSTIKVNKNYEIVEGELSSFVKSQIYRVIQEALNNIVKYSEASEVLMNLRQGGGILTLEINDDGKGFEVEKVINGNGLQNITHRVKRSNGLVNINSQKGHGTRVTVKMPVC
ncbi:PAS domain S-box protein [Ekhidna sp.]|uniref:hybrid sensor histidine kinase/response regulator n=1 Tax=Ekhidna sp. TaxID=2608089 RepID=UPI003518BAA3